MRSARRTERGACSGSSPATAQSLAAAPLGHAGARRHRRRHHSPRRGVQPPPRGPARRGRRASGAGAAGVPHRERTRYDPALPRDRERRLGGRRGGSRLGRVARRRARRRGRRPARRDRGPLRLGLGARPPAWHEWHARTTSLARPTRRAQTSCWPGSVPATTLSRGAFQPSAECSRAEGSRSPCSSIVGWRPSRWPSGERPWRQAPRDVGGRLPPPAGVVRRPPTPRGGRRAARARRRRRPARTAPHDGDPVRRQPVVGLDLRRQAAGAALPRPPPRARLPRLRRAVQRHCSARRSRTIRSRRRGEACPRSACS